MIQWREETYYRVREVAGVLRKSVQAVGDDIKAGRIQAVLIGNVRHVAATELDRFIGGSLEMAGPKIRLTMAEKRRAKAAGDELRRRGY